MSRILFLIFIFTLAVQRLFELRLSRKNEARILAAGGREHAAGHFGFMKLLHVSWFVAMITEVLWLRRPFQARIAGLALLVTAVGQCLRYAAIQTLGPRWTVRIMTLPAERPVTGGIYRYIDHPNYLGVILEIAAVPLVHGAYLTAVFFSLANALLLRVHIPAEEQALASWQLPATPPQNMMRRYGQLH